MIALPPLLLPPVALASPPAQMEHVPEHHAAGIVSAVGARRFVLFTFKTRRLLALTVPRGFHGVDSNDGVIRNATTAAVRPGMLADVTYRSLEGRHLMTRVDLLTRAACGRLTAAELATGARTGCPD